MSDKITNYQCPACTGPLHFDSNSGKLECEYCESSFDVAEIEALYEKKDEKAEDAFEKEQTKKEKNKEWDRSELTEDWGEDGSSVHTYNCPSCGAELICDATTAATTCPYCDNPNIVPGQLSGTLKPDYVIPFRLDKQAAIAALKEHYKGKFFLPKAFKEQAHLEEIKGIYVPFWLYDADADADAVYRATRTHSYTRGDYRITETAHFVVKRGGVIRFQNVPVDGSSKMSNAYMDSIEPYDFSELVPFSTAYLPGFLADRYDEDDKACAERAELRCQNSALDALEADIHGYHTLTRKDSHVDIDYGKVKYALMPVWTLKTKWEGKDYLFMMNGQTGKLVGDLPVDKKKYLFTFAGMTALLTGLFSITGIGKFLLALFFL